MCNENMFELFKRLLKSLQDCAGLAAWKATFMKPKGSYFMPSE